MGTAVFDTEAVTGFARNQVLRAAVGLLIAADWDIEVPAVTLAEAITGRPRDDATTHRTLQQFGASTTSEETAKFAGFLRARVARARSSGGGPSRLPSGVDAIVAAHAALVGGRAVVFTSDVDDLSRLLSDSPQVSVRRVP